tara:strand:+ start:58 stop:312 length:255 start_codon:yes stop_codon:yes gene_type:complete
MKIIKNTSLQGLSVTLTEGDNVKSIYLMPGKKIEVPSSWGGNILKNLVSRRMVKVLEVADPAPTPVPQKPVKVARKKTPIIKGN